MGKGVGMSQGEQDVNEGETEKNEGEREGRRTNDGSSSETSSVGRELVAFSVAEGRS